MFTAAFAVIGLAVASLTWLGLRDAPPRFDPNAWGPQSIAGFLLAEGEDATCARCHVEGGPGSPVQDTRISRDDDWLSFHMADPVAIAPGARPADAGVRAGARRRPGPGRAGLPAAAARRRRASVGWIRPTTGALRILGTRCVACHTIDGDGGTTGPDLTRVGARRDAAAIRRIINDPNDEYGDSMMPIYGSGCARTQIACAGRLPGGAQVAGHRQPLSAGRRSPAP